MTPQQSCKVPTDIPVGPYQANVADIQLWDHSSFGQRSILPDTKLHFLSRVHVPSIPLYLQAGPSLKVFTNEKATVDWLSETLFQDEGLEDGNNASPAQRWVHRGGQSDYGILLGVDDQSARSGSRGKITELLIYAAADSGNVPMPSPSASFSPAPPDEMAQDSQDAARDINVYAIPLSSHLVNEAVSAAGLPTPPTEDPANPTSAFFLPYINHISPTRQKSQNKRQSLSTMFEDATQKRRKLKKFGGERVAQTMAQLDRPLAQNTPVIEGFGDQEGGPISTKGAMNCKSLSRASSLGSYPAADHARPVSRSGTLANNKRSSLHRVESAISPRDSSTVSGSNDSCSDQNKAALTKVVMAGMRLYGLQPRKKKQEYTVRADSLDNNLNETEAEDEYKLVYHHTFKAALFAFRRHLSNQLIAQEAMREVVDQFLHAFCTDPMASTAFKDQATPGFGTQGSDTLGYFDLPVNKQPPPTTPITWSTPIVKKR